MSTTKSALSGIDAARVWLNSEPLTTEGLRGRVTLVDFWTYSCVNWLRTLPYVRAWHERYRERGLVVVGLDAKDFRRDALDFAERFELTFPLVFDGPGDTVSPYGVTGFPETFVIDREGKIVDILVGAVDGDEERARLERAVEEALES